MHKEYDHKTAILIHLQKHFYLGIALGLLLLSLIFMALPAVFIDSHVVEIMTGVDQANELRIIGSINAYSLAFGTPGIVERSFNGMFFPAYPYGVNVSVGALFTFIIIILAIVAIAYVYVEEQYYSLAFLFALLLLIMAFLNFFTLPVAGLFNIDEGIPNSGASYEITHYIIGPGPILIGIFLLACVALIVVDYILVYVPRQDDMTFIKYKQELVDNDILLSVRHLKMFFPMGGGRKLKAVHDVSFDIKKGECFGMVGESGCGKTTTGRSVIRLHHVTSGSIYFKGYRIAAGSRWNEKEIKWNTIRTNNKIKELRSQEAAELENISDASEEGKKTIAEIRARYDAEVTNLKQKLDELVKFQKQKIRQIKYDDTHVNKKLMSKMQMIFQDPIDSLDPRMTVEDIIQEGLKIQGFRNRNENHKKACKVLEEVGLIADYCSRYPNEFSGGQRQRIGIARAIVMNPDFMICDEPISALDVSIRAQIINLLNDLKVNHGLTLMFIAHDLSVVKYFCDRIAVMYFGEMVELATSDELFAHPLHPYTRSLLSAIPKPDPFYEKKRVRIVYRPTEEHDYSVEKPTFQEIVPGHFVLANSAEIEKYKQMIKEDDIKNAELEKERKEKGLEY
jgi:oligopeptide transport system ATP-binding protein